MNFRCGNQWISVDINGIVKRIGVLCRRPSARFSSSGRYRAQSTGNAHGRAAKGNFTLIAIVTHLCPQTQTTWLCVERTASWCRPLP